MHSSDISKINAAYVATWQQNNPKLLDIKTDGKYLYYQKESIDIEDIYMQDLFSNSELFYRMNTISAKDLFCIIKVHVYATKIKESKLNANVRRMYMDSSTTSIANSTAKAALTVEEYFSLRDRMDLSPEEIVQKSRFEDFIKNCLEFEAYLSKDAQRILNEYNMKQLEYAAKREMNTKPEMNVESNNIVPFPLPPQEEPELVEEQGPVRTLTKAGYINSTVILIVILNIGFIVAMAFLGR